MKIRWWPHTRNRNIASVRLRCFQVMRSLRALGHDVGLYLPGVGRPDVLVLSKRYDQESISHAARLRARTGVRIALDLCDNHFYFEDGRAVFSARAETLQAAVLSADIIVSSSEALAAVIREHCPEQRNVVVIGDAVEPLFHPGPSLTPMRLMAEIKLARLCKNLQESGVPQSRRIVWFGSHGSPGVTGGMMDLRRIRGHVSAADEREPGSLTVVSNQYDFFKRIAADFGSRTFYLPWNYATFSRALALHSLAVVPITINPFTLCKTNNRVATSLLHGLNVVADTIPAYSEFADAIVLNDWAYGLGDYLYDTELRRRHVESGKNLVVGRYSPEAIARLWERLLIKH